VFIGKGIARGKTDLYNILQGLAGTLLLNADGTQRGAITPKRWIELMEETLGMKLTSSEEEMEAMQPPIEQAQFDQSALTGLNPVGNNDVVQKPQQTPEGLMNNVPQMPGGDSRGLVI
jgi:hypothetical protein